MSQEHWHYATGNVQHDPIPFQDLQRLAAAGELDPGDLVWKKGMPEWIPAKSVDQLFETRAPSASPVIAPAPAKVEPVARAVAPAAPQADRPQGSIAERVQQAESIYYRLRDDNALPLKELLGPEGTFRRNVVFSALEGLMVVGVVFALLVLLAGISAPFVSLFLWIGSWVGISLLLYLTSDHGSQGSILRLAGSYLRPLLGDEQSLRRRLVLTLVFSAPFLWLAKGSAPVERFNTFFFVLAGFFYLMGFVANWSETGNESHRVLDNLEGSVPDVRAAIAQRMLRRQIPDLEYREIEIEEQGLYSFGHIGIDSQRTEIMQLTQGRARLILRVQRYGTDLYIRWESYFDLSGRRLSLLVGLFFSWVNSFLIRWAGTGIYEMLMQLRFVLTNQGKPGTTGGRATETAPFQSFGLFENVPSHLLDSLYGLEETVTQSAEEVLNEVWIQSGREEKIELQIQRSMGPAKQLF